MSSKEVEQSAATDAWRVGLAAFGKDEGGRGEGHKRGLLAHTGACIVLRLRHF